MPAHRDTHARLRRHIDGFPVVDCHEHAQGPQNAPENREPVAYLVAGTYLESDLETTAYPGSARAYSASMIAGHSAPSEDKWPRFEPLRRRTHHTAHARVLRDVYGGPEMSLAALQRIRAQAQGVSERRVPGCPAGRGPRRDRAPRSG